MAAGELSSMFGTPLAQASGNPPETDQGKKPKKLKPVKDVPGVWADASGRFFITEDGSGESYKKVEDAAKAAEALQKGAQQ